MSRIWRGSPALEELEAENIAVPPVAAAHLERGHAVHFRCHSAEAMNVRIDVMARLRGVAPFTDLWARRTTVEDDAGNRITFGAAGSRDGKKNAARQRLADVATACRGPLRAVRPLRHPEQLRFWLFESRTPQMLLDLAVREPTLANELTAQRPLLQHAIQNDLNALRRALADEESREREADRLYWEPLKRELEAMRRAQRRNRST